VPVPVNASVPFAGSNNRLPSLGVPPGQRVNPLATVKLSARMLYKCYLPSGFEMRAKLIFAALVGLLFCSLAALETTELVKLADNTSNDFSLLGTRQEASSANVTQGRVVRPKPVPATDGSEPPTVRRRAAVSSHPAKDFLHFLCIMRT
jgi:hypothetical protein